MKSILIFLILITSTIIVLGQQGTISAGGDIKSVDGTISYSTGQLMNSSFSSTTGSIYEGLQQPYEIIWTSLTPWAKELGLHIQVFPNPTNDHLNLVFDKLPPAGCTVTCTTMTGVKIISQAIIEKQTQLQLQAFSSGTYFMVVQTKETQLSTFTIIKQ